MARASLIHAILDKAADSLSRGLETHHVQIGARSTSARFDQLTWQAVRDVARREGISITALCTAINEAKPRHLSLTVAIRVAVLQYYMDAATEHGHIMAGHGKIARWL